MLSTPKLNVSELVEEIHLRTKIGAEALYDQYSKILLLNIFRQVKDIKETNDILELVFKEIWNSIDLFRLQQKSFLTWSIYLTKTVIKEYYLDSKEINNNYLPVNIKIDLDKKYKWSL